MNTTAARQETIWIWSNCVSYAQVSTTIQSTEQSTSIPSGDLMSIPFPCCPFLSEESALALSHSRCAPLLLPGSLSLSIGTQDSNREYEDQQIIQQSKRNIGQNTQQHLSAYAEEVASPIAEVREEV